MAKYLNNPVQFYQPYPFPALPPLSVYPSDMTKNIYNPGDIVTIEGKDAIEMWGSPISSMRTHPRSSEYFEFILENKQIQAALKASTIITPGKPKIKVSLSTVVMPDHKKEEIRAAISQTKNTALIFDEWGFGEVFEKGMAVSLLFWGIPGTGKTLAAQAIADELESDLKVYGVAEIQTSEMGGAEREIQAIFAKATRNNRQKGAKQHIILLDECDSLLMDRNEVGVILGATVNQLLIEIEKYDGIIIFTTNRMGKLDPALERRLSAKIEFEFPDEAQRLDIWKRMIPQKAPISKSVNLKKLAKYPLAGGNIKNAVLNAARRTAYENKTEITQQHFVDAIEREAKALAAFVSEYEDQTHQQMVGINPKRVVRTQVGVRTGVRVGGHVGKSVLRVLQERGDNE